MFITRSVVWFLTFAGSTHGRTIQIVLKRRGDGGRRETAKNKRYELVEANYFVLPIIILSNVSNCDMCYFVGIWSIIYYY